MHKFTLNASGNIIKHGLKLIPVVLIISVVCYVTSYPLFTVWYILKVLSLVFFIPSTICSIMGILLKEKSTLIMENINAKTDDMNTRAFLLHCCMMRQKYNILGLIAIVAVLGGTYLAVLWQTLSYTRNSLNMLYLTAAIFPLTIFSSMIMDKLNRLSGYYTHWEELQEYDCN